jgi:hypothetical protein
MEDTSNVKHVCSFGNHCVRCGECIPKPRILCDICREFRDKTTTPVVVWSPYPEWVKYTVTP